VPVWHERTRERVATGDLFVVAIASEQHRERTALWAEHQGIDWPIAWDPFNLTGSFAVPNAILVDARGAVVRAGVRVDELDALLDGLTPPDADTRLDVVAVRGTGDGADRVCVHATIAARTHEPRRVRLAPTDLEPVTIGTRVATLGRRFAFGTDALRYTVDLPLEVWESDAPLPARFVFERHATDEDSRRIETWVDLRAFAE